MTNRIIHNAGAQRYEIHVDDELAGVTETREEGDVVTFPHTEVYDRFEGQGLASALVGGALDDVRSREKKVIATCDYVARFLDKHPDYADLRA